VGNFIHQFAEHDFVLFIDNHHSACGQPFQRAFLNAHAIITLEFRVTQRRQRDDIAQAFCAAEAGLRERQICGDAQNHGVIYTCGQLVKFTH